MNKSDSQRIAGFLEKNNYQKTLKMKEADLIIVNMCSVRQSAVDRIFGLAQKIIEIKKEDNKKRAILTGCILKEDRLHFEEKFDYLLDIRELPFWLEYLSGKKRKKKTKPRPMNCFKIKPLSNSWPIGYVPIATGCNNFCSYCVVPYIRGEEVSRPAKDILQEVKNLVKRDYKEIWLLGQNVNSYRSEIKKEGKNKTMSFPDLLKEINSIPGNFWIRFTSSHPKDLSKELINTMARLDKITPYLHLAVQSGDNKILKKMNRKYRIEEYQKKIKELKGKMPAVNLSTDIIVGFPEETKKQFENTLKLVRAVKFDMIYIACYSPRPGTVAAKMDDNIPLKEKKQRERILNKILEKDLERKNKKYLNKIITVLPFKKEKDFLMAKSFDYKTVKIETDSEKIGQFIQVKVIKTGPWGLLAEPIKQQQPVKKEKLPKLIVILGPTASGKTDLSLKLAQWLRKEKKLFSLSGAEIISADSRQVYKGMDLGTAKITREEMGTIPHHLLDVASPKRKFSVAQYQKKVFPLLKKIEENNKIALLVGGSPFYIYSITEGWSFPQLKPDWLLRKKLEKKSCSDLLEILRENDPRRAREIEKKNKRRIIRAIEIARVYGQVPVLGEEKKFQILFLGIRRSKEELRELIRKRLSKRFSQGMIKEVKRLKNQSLSWQRLESFGLEYRWIAKYLQDKIDYQTMIKKLQKDIEHFAKRQMTWFKKDKRIKWVKNFREAQRETKKFLEE